MPGQDTCADLATLACVFMDDYSEEPWEDGRGKSGTRVVLRILPSLASDDDEVVVSADLQLCLPAGYPRAPLASATVKRSKRGSGLLSLNQEAEVNRLVAQQLAAGARDQDLLWRLVTLVQEYLSRHNKHPESEHAKMMKEQRARQELARQQQEEEQRRLADKFEEETRDILRRRHHAAAVGDDDYMLNPPVTRSTRAGRSQSALALRRPDDVSSPVTGWDFHQLPSPLRSDDNDYDAGPSFYRQPSASSSSSTKTTTAAATSQQPNTAQQQATAPTAAVSEPNIAVTAFQSLPSASLDTLGSPPPAIDIRDLSKWERSMREQIQGETDLYLMINKAASQFVMVREVQTKAVQQLERRIASLKPLSHKHIASYLDVGRKPGTVMIFMEYCGDTSISALRWQYCSEMHLQIFARQILLGLQYLHSQGVAHGNLTRRTTLLDSRLNVKLCDWGYHDLMHSGPASLPRACLQDLRQLGCLLLSLVAQKNVKTAQQAERIVANPAALAFSCSPVFFDFIKLCVSGSSSRVTIPKLIEHAFVVGVASSLPECDIPADQMDLDGFVSGTPPRRLAAARLFAAASSLSNNHNNNNNNNNHAAPGRSNVIAIPSDAGADYLPTAGFGIDTRDNLTSPSLAYSPQTPSDMASSSGSKHERYFTDFEELKEIGGGAFGVVYEVQNRLDGRKYAIKKIPLAVGADPRRAQIQRTKVLREVTTLASLQHQYIVRYFQSWIGEDHLKTAPSGLLSSDDDDGDDDVDGSQPSGGDDDDFLSIHSQRGSKKGDKQPQSPVANDGAAAGSADAAAGDDYGGLLLGWSDGDSPDPLWDDSDCDQHDDDDDDEDEDEEEDEEEDDEEDRVESGDDDVNNEEEVSTAGSHRRRRLSQSGYYGEVLYIQMELCSSKTLRTLVDDGVCYGQPEVRWRMLGQMLEALSYIHSQGIIHRDLKPENIFIDGRDNIQIGDFGLAAYGKAAAAATTTGAELVVSLSAATADQLKTQGVGTPLYSAPEVLRGERYDEKVDMYSVGVMLFEMCAKDMKLGSMERIYTLQRFLDAKTFPAELLERDAHVPPIVLALVSDEPSKRPSPAALLSSDFLPRTIDQDTLRTSIRTLTEPGTLMYRDLVETLFNKSVLDDCRGFAFDWSSNRMTLSDVERSMHEIVCASIVEPMKRHGAARLSPPFLLPMTEFCTSLNFVAARNAVTLMNRNGTPAMLPFDLTLPFARHLLHQLPATSPLYLKRFQLAPVFRTHHIDGARSPTEYLECDFDVASTGSSPLLRLSNTAEAMQVLAEVMASFQPILGQHWTIRVNHWALVDLLLTLCRVPADPALRTRVYAELERSWRLRWPVVARNLRELLPAATVDDLSRFMRLSGPIALTVQQKLKPLIAEACDDYADKLPAPLEELVQLDQILQRLGTPCQRYKLDLRLCYNKSYYDKGIVFQAVAEQQANNTVDVVAAGGCYDYLLRQLAQACSIDASSARLTASGFNIAVKKIIEYTRFTLDGNGGHQQKNPLLKSLRSSFACLDVLLCVVGGSPTLDCFSILADLWALHLRADLLRETPSLDEVVRHCKRSHVPYLLILTKRTFASSRTLRLRLVAEKTADVEIPRANLVEVLKVHLASLIGHSSSARLRAFDSPIIQPLPSSIDPALLASSHGLIAAASTSSSLLSSSSSSLSATSISSSMSSASSSSISSASSMLSSLSSTALSASLALPPPPSSISSRLNAAAATGVRDLILATVPAQSEKNLKKTKTIIQSRLSGVSQFLVPPIHVVAVDLPFAVVRDITAQPYRASVNALEAVVQSHFRYKHTLELLQNYLNQLLNAKSKLVIMWSLPSERFDILLPFSPASFGRR